MPRITLNLNDAQSRSPLPVDDYIFRIFDFSEIQSGPKSNYMTVILEVAEGEYEGRKVYHNMPVDGAGAGIFADFLSVATGEEIDVDELDEYEFDTDDLIGTEIAASIKHEVYKGDTNHRINKFFPVES